MGYRAVKVYSDGSHYIGIPPELQLRGKRKKTVRKKEVLNDATKTDHAAKSIESSEVTATADVNTLFETLYKENYDKKYKKRRENIIEGLKAHIPDETALTAFVEQELSRRYHNEVSRKTRLYRKVNLQEWHYFASFTYDGNKISEQDFRKKLSDTLKKMASRKGWKYIGVWERSPKKQRLHFHALIYAPEMVGEFETIRDYSIKTGRMREITQNTYFQKRFGRNDFDTITPRALRQSVRYLTKYIIKSGERIVYSKGLPTYFISDINDDDVVCNMGIDDRKLLLFDDFLCMDEGLVMGRACKEVIAKMPKAN